LVLFFKVSHNKTGIGSLRGNFSLTNDAALTLPTLGGIKKVCELFLLFLRNIKSLLGFVQSGGKKFLEPFIMGGAYNIKYALTITSFQHPVTTKPTVTAEDDLGIRRVP
jgi:hypothetical protein